MAIWPVSLPPPLVEGYGATLTIPASRPEFGAGWTRHARVTGAAPQRITATWKLDPEQHRDLALFMRDHAGEWGSLELRMPGESGATSSVLARIVGPLRSRARGRGDRVSAELEVAPL